MICEKENKECCFGGRKVSLKIIKKTIRNIQFEKRKLLFNRSIFCSMKEIIIILQYLRVINFFVILTTLPKLVNSKNNKTAFCFSQLHLLSMLKITRNCFLFL